jgi:very-short-patch-repair endonuclease
VVHRVGDLLPADAGWRGPIAVTSPLRTAIDLAAVLDIDSLEVAIESALRRRLFSVGQLRWRADALMGTRRPGSSALRELLDARQLGVADSGWEVRTAQLLEVAGLGSPVRQHEIRADGRVVARVDLAYPDEKLVVEYDSDAWHTGVARRHRDAERRNRLRALGWTVLEVTPGQLRSPQQLLAAVALVLAA